jgi:hypothetical protein
VIASPDIEASDRVEVRRQADYPSDDLGFLQRTHPLRGRPFGQLVYMADSVMQPMKRPGFGMHPHVNVEVISYVAKGSLTHRDSAGNGGIVPVGAFQRITAGTGIEHDESNRTDAPLRMFQIWFASAVPDVAPNYAIIETAGRTTPDAFTPVIASGGPGGALDINAEASIAVGRFAPDKPIGVEVGSGRVALLYVVDGAASWDRGSLDARDQLRLRGPARLTLRSTAQSELLLIESAA